MLFICRILYVISNETEYMYACYSRPHGNKSLIHISYDYFLCKKDYSECILSILTFLMRYKVLKGR